MKTLEYMKMKQNRNGLVRFCSGSGSTFDYIINLLHINANKHI